MDGSIILIGFTASAIAGVGATGAGAVPILFIRHMSDRLEDMFLGFAAGIMLAASFFSLIIPGIDKAYMQVGSKMLATLIVVGAILLGGAFLWLLNKYVPHEHFIMGRYGVPTSKIQRIWLFIAAITLHNFPEGMSVGVSFGDGNISNGTTLALAIGIQNMPEGLAVAVSLASLGYSRWAALAVATLTGMVEPVGGLLGVAAVTVFTPLLPWGLGFAAGAMIFVISNEIIPETHRKGHEDVATGGLMIGLAVMLVLDVAIG